jgi:predicted RND superfamily exporter protein
VAFAEMHEQINRDMRRSTVASAIGVLTVPTMALRSPVPPGLVAIALASCGRSTLWEGYRGSCRLLTSRRRELWLNLRFVGAWIRTMERAGPGVLFSGLASAIGYCRPAAPGSC